MRRYLARRVGQAVLVLWAAYTLSFILLSALPGDSVRNRINAPDSLISPEAAKTLLTYYGLDQSLLEQYLRGLRGIFTGDLGFSLTNGQSVLGLIGDALPSTIQLTAAGFVFGTLFAGTIGLAINYAPWGWLRSLLASVPALFASVPTFVVGIVALQYLSFQFHLIPSVDNGTFLALLAPAATLGIVVAGPLAQVFAASIRHTRGQPFVHVLQAKGAGEGFIFRKGVLRNSSLPVLTLLGLILGELIAGSVVTETVYARKGLGQLVVGSVNTQDLPVVQGVVIVSTLVYVIANLAVDIAYPFIDPRILLSGSPSRRGVRARLKPASAVLKPEAVEPAEPRRLPVEVAMP